MNKYKELYLNYLRQLKDEISSYPSETDVWKLSGTITNSPGNLAMHLCGNLKYNFGSLLLKNGYVRHRDNEFSRKDTPKEVILNEIESTVKVVSDAFDELSEDDLNKDFPSDIYGEKQTIGSVLMRLAFHFTYHLGQINYHRRLLQTDQSLQRFRDLFLEFINELRDDITSYPNESDLWKLYGGYTEPPGKLAMNVCDSIKYNFGTLILMNGYKRHDWNESGLKNTTKQMILDEIESSKKLLEEAFGKLKENDLQKGFMDETAGEGQTIGMVLTRLSVNFAYNVSQLTHQRRHLK